MAWLERRGKRFRLLFRFNNEKYHVNLKTSEQKEADSCRARLEENLRLVERGRLPVPAGADLGLFLITDGKLDQKVEVVRVLSLSEMFHIYQTKFTSGAKEAITRRLEDVHMKHLLRLLGDRPITEVTSPLIQKFVDERSAEVYRGSRIKSVTVKKAIATLRFIWNWAYRQQFVPTKFPQVELVFPKSKQSEPFRTFDQIQVIIAREKSMDSRRLRELWDGLFLDPKQVAEVLAIVKRKSVAQWFYPFLATAAFTGARRAELLRARIEDFDFEANLVLLREKKRSRHKETFRTVDLTPLLTSVLQDYFGNGHAGGELAFCSKPNATLRDGEAGKAFRRAVGGSRWQVLRGYHAFRHSFASNLAAAGVDSRVICELMGHQTAEMEARYRHLFPVRRRAAIELVFGNAATV